jgi:hypothetical protein
MGSSVKVPGQMGTYHEDDVIFLLKDLSGIKLEDTIVNREKQMQSGGHYSESLPIEYQPPNEYVDLFWRMLAEYKSKVAVCIGIVAQQIYDLKGEKTVLVSLARAGTPVGILIKRFIELRFNITLPHYSISIIRDRGIDENAIAYILNNHPGYHLQFVDGWTGKGAISIELTKACSQFVSKYGVELDDTLAVIADPGYCTNLYGTREDFLIPSACLNSTVSGLISRTILNKLYIGEHDFHGAKFYKELMNIDVSNEFIDVIYQEFPGAFAEIEKILSKRSIEKKEPPTFLGMSTVKRIQNEFNLTSTHMIKPGIGETTRVLLRRVPWKILMKDPSSPYVKHIHMLAKEKGVEVVRYERMNYLCCGLIKSITDIEK